MLLRPAGVLPLTCLALAAGGSGSTAAAPGRPRDGRRQRIGRSRGEDDQALATVAARR